MSLRRIGGLMKRDDFRYLKKFSTSAVAFADDVFSLGKLNHVAIACPDLKKAADFYKNILGAEVSEPMNLPNHGVTTVFVNLGNSKIELLHPLGDKSPISGYLKKNTLGGMHHICVEVDNIEKAIATVKSKGIKCLADKASIGAHGKPTDIENSYSLIDEVGILRSGNLKLQNFLHAIGPLRWFSTVEMAVPTDVNKKDSGFHVNCCCQKTMTEPNIEETTMNTNLFNTNDHSTLILAKSLPTARPYRSVAFKTWTVGDARNLFINNCQSLPTSGRIAVGCGSSGEEKNNQLLGYYVNGNYSAPQPRRCLNKKSSTVLQSCSAVVEQSFHQNDYTDRNEKITATTNDEQLACLLQSVDNDVSKRLIKTLPKNLKQYKEHFVHTVHSSDASYIEATVNCMNKECSSNFIPKKTLHGQCRQWLQNTFKQMNSKKKKKKKKINNQPNFHCIGNSFTKKHTTAYYGNAEPSTAQIVECFFSDDDISCCDTVAEPHCCISSAYFDFNAERLEKLKKQMVTVRNDDIMLIHKLHQLEKEIFIKKQNIRENLLKRNMEYSELYCRSLSLPRCLKFAHVKPSAPWYESGLNASCKIVPCAYTLAKVDCALDKFLNKEKRNIFINFTTILVVEEQMHEEYAMKENKA
ncbi:Methylmalonyl-CoA epimerase, mitochondrial [Trichinella papuae]|uniref:Methylmalonyl-CoA epimerase, mitochondrial n=1 Tax=Trichinella papuae TaxID=268474 RepID=A0A0V1MRK0_9BILA|nr:Methylmalonyl-CoA epimerase, mitochondrial [Trichinella papuae]